MTTKLPLILAATLLMAGTASAQPPEGGPPPAGQGGPGGGRPGGMAITQIDLGGGVILLGGGSNATLALASKSAILVDTKFGNPQALVDAVKKATALPVSYVINTHAHPDHTGGNEAFGQLGATIESTPAAAARMAVDSVGGRGNIDKAVPPIGRPTKTFSAKTVISVPGQSATVYPVPAAHTDGDAFVFFPKANVLVLGDLHHSNEWPVYDAATGCKCGSFAGNLAAYHQALALANAQTKIVPGHGGLTDKAEVTAYVATLEKVQGQVKALIAQGRSKEEVVAAKLLADVHVTQAGGPNNADAFVGTLYDALKTGRGA